MLTYDNGEFDVHVAFFADPDRLTHVVRRLCEERIDYNTGDLVDVERGIISLRSLPANDDAAMDMLADLLNADSEADVEDGVRAAERREEELAEAEDDAKAPAVAPGQTSITEMLEREASDPNAEWNTAGYS